MSRLSGAFPEMLYANTLAGTSLAATVTESQINDTTGMGTQFSFPQGYFPQGPTVYGKAFSVSAQGLYVTTSSAADVTINVRLGASGAVSSQPIILGTAANALVPTATGGTYMWQLNGNFVLQTPAGSATPGRGTGSLICPGIQTTLLPVYGGSASPGTVNMDVTIQNFLFVTAKWATATASNSIQLLQLIVEALN